MSEFIRQKFFYKLCVVIKGRIYCFVQRSLEMTPGTNLTQDIENHSPYLFVYRSPEQAVSNEIQHAVREFTTKIFPKTVVKIMCWGKSIETPVNLCFDSMSVLEDIGMPKKPEQISQKRDMSTKVSLRFRQSHMRSPRKEATPYGLKLATSRTPVRIYNCSAIRKRSPRSYIPSRIINPKVNVHELLKKMQEDTEKLDKEIKDIETWNKLVQLEDEESVLSTETPCN